MNSRQTTIITHVATWAALLFVPMMTTVHGDGLTPRHVLVSVGIMLSFMAVFYTNFLWITPRYYTKGERRYFLLINIAVIIGVSIAFHLWMNLCNTYYPDPRKHPDEDHLLIYLLHSMFNLGIVCTVATSLQLASRWRKTEEARLEAEAARTDAELKTLRNQINPHFLLNTLNNIYALTAIDTTRAQDAIQQLSKLLRHLLYDYEQPTVPLQNEVEFLENYISLMKIRLPQAVEVQSRFTVRNPQLQVAPLIFISLVENAFKHGVSPTEPSFIHVSIETSEDTIACDISNSNHPKTASDHSGHGIGLQQVQRRLDLAYPGRYTWTKGVSDDGKTYSSRIVIKG